MYDACVPWPERPKGAKDKSRGPKGLELEVGARRAPKLLVSNIAPLIKTKCIFANYIKISFFFPSLFLHFFKVSSWESFQSSTFSFFSISILLASLGARALEG